MTRRRIYGPPLVRALLVVAALVGIASMFYVQGGRIAHLERQRDTAEADARTLAGQVRELGGQPKVSPPAATRPPVGAQNGRDGADGRPPTQQEIARAVAAYLAANPPVRGRPPTMAEILTAVTGYLTEHPPPAGPAGRDGVDGKDGKDGADGTDGKDAPPPTSGQIRAAVDDYLSAHPLACPDGYTAESLTVISAGGPRQVMVCAQ